MKNLRITFSFLILLFMVAPSFAHHSSAPHFDESVEIVLEGTVTDWKFVNPHSYLHFDVTDADGKTENWRCEMHARTPMQRNGFTKETFFAGQKISVTGSPGRREANLCGLLSFKFADGTEIDRNGELPEKYRTGTVLNEEIIATTEERPEFLENGQPNISGFWVRASRGGPPAGGAMGAAEGGAAMGEGGGMAAMGGGMGGNRPQYDSTEVALAEQATYEQIYDNPSIQCDITNIFFGWTHDANVNQVTQQDDKITLLYGYMDFTRTIHLTDKHPANITPSRGGYSIGRWEGKKLIVETTGFTPGVFNPLVGNPYGSNMSAVETFELNPETDTLERSYTIEDPEYLNTAFTNSDSMIRSDLAYAPYDCIELSGENNTRPEARAQNQAGSPPATTVSSSAPAASVPVTANTMPTTTASSNGWMKPFGVIVGIFILILGFLKLRGS